MYLFTGRRVAAGFKGMEYWMVKDLKVPGG
jgi:hypothetical protein